MDAKRQHRPDDSTASSTDYDDACPPRTKCHKGSLSDSLEGVIPLCSDSLAGVI